MEKWFKRKLVELAKASRSQPDTQRLGQRLYNLIAGADLNGKTMDERKSQDYLADFHARLFYIEDEELVKIIEKDTA